MTARTFWIASAALISTLAVVQVSTMLDETQTWDEGIHLAAGYSYLTSGDYSLNPEHPALGKILCALPLLPLKLEYKREWTDGPSQIAGLNFMYANRASPDLILGLARSVTVLLTAAFAFWIACWTRSRFGEIAGLTALGLFCFDPNIIAHGRYVTTDLVASLFIFLACTLWLDYLAAPSPRLLCFAGLALGAAVTSKYSALFLVPLFIVSGLIKRRWRATAVVMLLALAVIALVYFPEVWERTNRDRLFGHLTGKGMVGATLLWASHKFSMHTWTYLVGLDRLSEHNASGHLSYLLGQFSDHGWWYYFPVAFAVKTPLATLGAIAAAAFLIWKVRVRRFHITGLALVAVIFFAFCLTSRITIGYRHLLPMLAFLFVLAGVALSRYPKVAAALVLLLSIESASIFPNYLSFFNAAVGGPSNGHKYLLDSNLDWGQDLKRLGRYLKSHKIESLCMYYFGNGDLPRYGVNGVDFPHENAADCDKWGAVSATTLFGLYAPPDYFAFLRDHQPDARIGYSIYLFDLRKKK